MKLFKMEGFKLEIEEEAYALKPFRILWNRDKSKDKSKAIMDLGYIYFMVDPRSDYQMYLDEDERSEKIKKGEGLDSKWQPDKDIIDAMEFYKSFIPISAGILNDTRAAAEKLRKMLRDINIDERNDKGKPVYPLNVIISTIKQVPELVKALDEAEKAINNDIKKNDKVRGTKVKHLLEDN